ncbi:MULTISPECIES: hypothetical protein [Promicromonospora]|uniref:Uncharacterized protein n=2 Tax=Promicromonospora TaxID=43676 RepID=A0ABW4UZQ3_9MICO
MATVIQTEHARHGFETLANLYGLSCAVIEARAEITNHHDRHGHPLGVVVIEALADAYSDAEQLATKLKLDRADTALTSQAGLVCWIGWLRHVSQYDPVTLRLYAPTTGEGAAATPEVVS